MGDDDWLALVQEQIIEPERPIIDPHHHLWRQAGGAPSDYLVEQLQRDTGSGHNVVKTVFVECWAEYRTDGPEHLKPVGETEFVVQQAAESAATGGPEIAGIVAHADLRLEPVLLAEVIDAHEAAGAGLFRGIRQAGAHPEPDDELDMGNPWPWPGLYADPDFRRGVALLGERGLTYDTWHFHHQNPAFAELAAAVPGTTLVLDHFGTPLGVGRYAGRQHEVFDVWRRDIEAIAAHDNVVAKLGGMALPDNGFGFHERDTPPTSDDFVGIEAPYYHHTIDCFGPERCMFESNFPVDRVSVSYQVLYNAMKKMASHYTLDQQHELFYGTAARVYRL